MFKWYKHFWREKVRRPSRTDQRPRQEDVNWPCGAQCYFLFKHLDVAWYDRDELARCGTKYLFFHNFFILSDQLQYPVSMIFSWHVSLNGLTLLTSFSCLGLNFHKIELLSSQELNRTSFQNCLSFCPTSFKTGVRSGSKETLNSLLKHRKNCECCHHHSVFNGHNVIVHIVVLN